MTTNADAALPRTETSEDPAENFFAGARDGVLMIQQCEVCGANQYPLPGLDAAVRFCRTCAAPRPAWVVARGTGTVVSFTVLPGRRRSDGKQDAARVAGIVELTEGPWAYSALELRPQDVRIGTPVEVTFRDGIEPDRPVPVFRPRI